MKKVKLTESDLTRIVKQVINEGISDGEINTLISEYEKKLEDLCRNISIMGLEDLWDDQSITREIYDTISEIEDYDDDRLYDIKSKFEEFSKSNETLSADNIALKEIVKETFSIVEKLANVPSENPVAIRSNNPFKKSISREQELDNLINKFKNK